MQVKSPDLELMDRDECLSLIGHAALGRIGSSHKAMPTVVPVPFVFDGAHIRIPAGRDPALTKTLNNDVVAFEVDDIDAARQTGWHVVVTGRATIVPNTAFSDAPRAGWAPLGEGQTLMISPDIVSGQRIAPPRSDEHAVTRTNR